MGSFGAESPLIAGRYRLDFRLGRGGMGTVWRATDELLRRHVAVKEVHVGEGLPGSDVRSQRERTLREARTVAQLRHPSVVVVHDVVEEDERPWIVMELIVGQTLADRIAAEGSVPPREAARIGLALLGALREAHRHGVLHRDLKPANVLLEAPAGRVVLTDFGVARMDGGSTITESGTFVGSPEYTAPERMAGTGAGPESDLWSLGVLLCAALSGRTPFHQDSLGGVLHAVMAGDIRPPEAARPLLPAILGLLERDPARRMGGAEAEELLTEYLRTGRMPEVPRFARAEGGRAGTGGGAGADAAGRAGYAGPPPDAVRPGDGHPVGPPPGPLLPPRGSRHRGRTALAAALMVAAAGGTGVAAVAMLVNGDTPLDERPTSTSRPDGTTDDDGDGGGGGGGGSRGPTRPTATPSASRSSARPGPSGSGPSTSGSLPPGPSGTGRAGRSAPPSAVSRAPDRLSGPPGAPEPAPAAGAPAAEAPLPSVPEVTVPPLTGRLPAASGAGEAGTGGDGAPERLRADEEAAAGCEREHPRAPW
ncbi:serine/threonine protein kinase [Streptomyces sp. F63]|uniref:serine/threonine-protein kinase n=1 Tax=Streptomyces sp. F63 TaxID=2824887 RepID=UPI001B387002|nr:serine/threonine-protein kinase [Streptomyces sp. F63]MBQ0986030.1 serine/threonine protein kinase [Streptomyces sp. F63]